MPATATATLCYGNSAIPPVTTANTTMPDTLPATANAMPATAKAMQCFHC